VAQIEEEILKENGSEEEKKQFLEKLNHLKEIAFVYTFGESLANDFIEMTNTLGVANAKTDIEEAIDDLNALVQELEEILE